MKKIALFILSLVPIYLLAQPTFAEFAYYTYLKDGQAKCRVGRYAEAIKDFDKAIAGAPNLAEAYHYRGIAHFVLKQYRSAEQDFTQSINMFEKERNAKPKTGASDARNSNNPYLSGRNGILLIDPEDEIKQSWDYAMQFNNRGAAYHHLGEYRKAIKDFDKALALNSSLEVSRRNRERSYLKLGISNPTPPPQARNANTGRDNGLTNGSTNGATTRQNTQTNSSALRRPSSSGNSVSISTPSNKKPKSRFNLFGSKNRKYPVRIEQPPSASQTSNYLRLTRIEMDAAATTATLEINNREPNSIGIYLEPPGSEGAFYLHDTESGQQYRLTRIFGISTRSGSVHRLDPGQRLVVTLLFDPLPAGTVSAHLIEGKNQDDSKWNFYDINLSK